MVFSRAMIVGRTRKISLRGCEWYAGKCTQKYAFSIKLEINEQTTVSAANG
jgi:hypothetical protein